MAAPQPSHFGSDGTVRTKNSGTLALFLFRKKVSQSNFAENTMDAAPSKRSSLQRKDTTTQMREILADSWMKKLIYTKNANQGGEEKFLGKLRKKVQDHRPLRGRDARNIEILRGLRRADSPYHNAYIENAIRHIRDTRDSKEKSLAIFDEALTELYSFEAYPPVFNQDQIEAMSLGEFLDVMEGEDATDREELRKCLFIHSQVPVEEQRKYIRQMTNFVKTYHECSESSQKKKLIAEIGSYGYGNNMDPSEIELQIERGKAVQQFCDRWMKAAGKGIKLNKLPGCGIGVQNIVEKISGPGRTKQLHREHAIRENPPRKVPRARTATENPLAEINPSPKNIQQ